MLQYSSLTCAKKTITTILSKRNVTILIIIVATAVLLSILLYHYSSFTSNKIIDIAGPPPYVKYKGEVKIEDDLLTYL